VLNPKDGGLLSLEYWGSAKMPVPDRKCALQMSIFLSVGYREGETSGPLKVLKHHLFPLLRN